ncbi:MAG: site-specific integrase [Pirellulales bacterium]
MPTAWSSGRQPKYRHHKASGNAVVTVYGRDVYLGKFGSKESKLAYSRLMVEWVGNEGVEPPPKSEDLTVAELANAYRRWAKRHYVREGVSIATYSKVELMMKQLGKNPYGLTAVCNFGPSMLKGLQAELANSGKARRYVNDLIDIVRRCFKWGVSEELVAVSVLQALQTVSGLRRGRTKARETEPVKPVEAWVVDATLQFLPPVVDDMIRLLRLLGCRPQELCDLRPCDVDMSGDVWVYRPKRHKTAHHGRERSILIGTKAQAVLQPYMVRDSDTYCFSPAESVARRRAELHESRRTPLSCGNRPGTNRRTKPIRQPGEKYCPTALNRAVRRAADKANEDAKRGSASTEQGDRLAPHWFVYQLRHAVATQLRKEFGLEAAQVILGHSRADVTQIYAEKDEAKAAEVMLKVG